MRIPNFTLQIGIVCIRNGGGAGCVGKKPDPVVRGLVFFGAGHRAENAVIDAEQAGSIDLHLRAGFEEVGRLREVGHKFGRWLDVVYMERLLDPL